jgi:hypothetical protein
VANVTSNLQEVVNEFKSMSSSLTMLAPGRYKGRLGQDVIDLVAQGIVDQTVLGQMDPSDLPLAPLARSTLERKRRLGYPETIGVETKKMLSMKQLRGTNVVVKNRTEMRYGVDQQSRDKSVWFQEGVKRKGGTRQSARPFYGLNKKIVADLDALITECLDRVVDRYR